MLVLTILAVGLIAGGVAHLLIDRHSTVSWPNLFVVGVAGSFIGGLFTSLFAGDGLAIRPSGLIGSAVGAALLLVVVRTTTTKSPFSG